MPVALPPSTVAILHATPFSKILAQWKLIEEAHGSTLAIKAELGRVDRYYLLVNLLGRADVLHHWLYARCREVEANTDGYLDLWAREHYKSTIITFAGIIQEVLKDPNLTVGIFSHVKPISKAFLTQIKREFEENALLKAAYPEVLYQDPKSESPQWSLDGGIVVKRTNNSKEPTVSGWGLTDGMPTGFHFGLMVFDDVVTLESVNTPEQVKKTTEAWELADNLGARGDDGMIRKWHIGTRYHFKDTYQDIIDKGLLKLRKYPATDNGLPNGKSVFLSQKALEEKKLAQGRHFGAQMLQNPAAGNEVMFQKDWLRFIDIRPITLNIYIMCDPASSRKKDSDRTAIVVVGVDAGSNRYLLDGYHHRMKLAERWHNFSGLRKHWIRQPGVQTVHMGYERYGMQADIEHFELEMQKPGVESFPIIELAWPREGPHAKMDRIQRLQPDFKMGKWYLPALVQKKDKEGRVIPGEHDSKNQAACRANGEAFRIIRPVLRRDEDGHLYNLNQSFFDEFLTYPFSVHDDFLDASSRIYDMDPVPPVIIDDKMLEPEVT